MTSLEANQLKRGDYVKTVKLVLPLMGRVVDVDTYTICIEWEDDTETCHTKEEMEEICLDQKYNF